MNKYFTNGLVVCLIILFIILLGWSLLGAKSREGFSGAAMETIDNSYSANVNFSNNMYSILIKDSHSVPIAAYYTNPVTLATLSNITNVTFTGESQNSNWNSSTATITIDNVNKTYTVTCKLNDKTTMTFVSPYTAPDSTTVLTTSTGSSTGTTTGSTIGTGSTT